MNDIPQMIANETADGKRISSEKRGADRNYFAASVSFLDKRLSKVDNITKQQQNNLRKEGILMSRIASDDYLVNVRAVYVLDTLGISGESYFDDPEQNRSVYREEVEVDAASYTISYKRGFGYEALAVHTLTTMETSYMLKELTEAFADVAQLPAPETDEEAPTVSLRLTYNSGTVIRYLCNFDRRSLPLKWLQFRNDIKAKFDFYNMRGDLLSETLIQYGVRSDEFICCTVYDNTTKNLGYFLTDDDSIRPGDRVSVPGEDGLPVTGKVSKVEYFTEYTLPGDPGAIRKIIRKIN